MSCPPLAMPKSVPNKRLINYLSMYQNCIISLPFSPRNFPFLCIKYKKNVPILRRKKKHINKSIYKLPKNN